VAELGSFDKAGRVLGISDSAVSNSVARLEARLDLRLLQREGLSLGSGPQDLVGIGAGRATCRRDRLGRGDDLRRTSWAGGPQGRPAPKVCLGRARGRTDFGLRPHRRKGPFGPCDRRRGRPRKRLGRQANRSSRGHAAAGGALGWLHGADGA